MQQKLESPEIKFGKNVASHIEFQGLSQRKFAEMLTDKGMAVDASAVSRMLKGNRAMRLSEVYTVAEVLGVSVRVLLPDLTSKRDEMIYLRRQQHLLWLSMSSDMTDLIDAAERMADMLHENPGLMEQLNKGVDDPLDSPENYLSWVAARAEAGVEELVNTGNLEPLVHFTYVRDEGEKRQLLDQVSALLAPFIIVGETPSYAPEGDDG